MIPDNAPTWLKTANTTGANVTIGKLGVVEWHDGMWHGGVWHGGVWHGGVWYGGEWHGGVWHGGLWRGGEWYDGVWRSGAWHDGVWRRGVWHDGVWHDGVWHGGEWYDGSWFDGEWRGGVWYGGDDRLLYMASLIGIVFDKKGYATAYRTTRSDGTGRFTPTFIQKSGKYFEKQAAPAGAGTCRQGIHVTTAARAWTYFGIDRSCQFWKVRFHRRDLLDCDGKKARIRGGTFTKIKKPF